MEKEKTLRVIKELQNNYDAQYISIQSLMRIGKMLVNPGSDKDYLLKMMEFTEKKINALYDKIQEGLATINAEIK